MGQGEGLLTHALLVQAGEGVGVADRRQRTFSCVVRVLCVHCFRTRVFVCAVQHRRATQRCCVLCCTSVLVYSAFVCAVLHAQRLWVLLLHAQDIVP